jgi:hypothetical protein
VNCSNNIPQISIRAGLYYWPGTAWELHCCNYKTIENGKEARENYASPCKVSWWVGYLWYRLIYINGEERKSEGAVGKQAHIETC